MIFNSHNNFLTLNLGLNEYGKIAEKQWHWLGKQYPYIKLHEFVVMPNHIHGIIEINRSIVVVGTARPVPTSKNQIIIRIDGRIQNHHIKTNSFNWQ